jgi:5-methylcytosine-specific restriction endonuclease McrA
MSAGRNTAQRDKDRATIARSRPNCHICGSPIDFALPHTDPKSYVVDHVIPLAKGGIDALANKKAAHRRQTATAIARSVLA